MKKPNYFYNTEQDENVAVCPVCQSSDLDYTTTGVICNNCYRFLAAIDDDDAMFEDFFDI